MRLESGDVFTAHVSGSVLILEAFNPETNNETAFVCIPSSESAKLLCYEDMETPMYLPSVDLLRCEDDHYKLVFDDYPVTFNKYEWKLFIEAIKSQAWRFLQ